MPFPGKEMHLLKCQIVRILHSSCICPKGYQKISENYKDMLEGKITEFDEEYKPLSFDDAKDPEFGNWTHEYPYIYPNGKIIDPTIEAQVDRMRGIGEDEGYKVKEGEGDDAQEQDLKYWKLRIIGDQIIYNVPDKDPVTQAVIHIQNTRWPGTHTVWKKGQFVNIYIGNGVKATGEGYYPTQLTKIDKDPEELTEHKEPNPEKEPEPPKPEGEEGQEGEEPKEGEEGAEE